MFIEETVAFGDHLLEPFVREIHQLAVAGLEREGDATPGVYRTVPVRIAQPSHLPPDPVLEPQYMSELMAFINDNHQPKYDLMKIRFRQV